MKLKAKIIGSKVHDVGYRVFMLDRAEELGLSGFEARNRKENGSQAVLVFMEGDEPQIAQLKDFIEQERPPGAEVSSIVFDEHLGTVLDIDKFHQRTNTHQLTKGINVLLSIDNKQDKMLDQQGKMLEKQDRMLEKQGQMLEKLDDVRVDVVSAVKESKDCVVSEIRALSNAIINQLGEEIRDSKDAIVEKLEETGANITREIRDHKSSIDQRFDRIEDEISKIKAKIGLS